MLSTCEGAWEMIDIVQELPEGVELSQHLRDKAKARWKGKKFSGYFHFTMDGQSYYVPITKDIWDAFGFTQKYKDHKPGLGELSATSEERALRDIAGALLLQLRDNILGNMERSVLDELHARLDNVLHQPLRKAIDDEAARRMLPPGQVAGDPPVLANVGKDLFKQKDKTFQGGADGQKKD
jgi:hypothetical protein